MADHLIHFLIAFALVVVVPLALDLHLPEMKRPWLFALIGAVAAMSFASDQGALAAALVVPWVLMAVGVIGYQVSEQAGWTTIAAARIIASVYMTVGAGWLLLSRYGAQPLGFDDPIVELTALHFHYAGFVAPVLTLQLISRLQRGGRGHARPAGVSLTAILIGMPITSLGFVVSPLYGTAGAAFLALGLTTAAVVTLIAVVPEVARPPAVALGISATSVVIAMFLAILYSIGQWADLRAPSMTAMAWTHGLLNSLGFAFCGVAGWRLLRRG